MENPTRLAKFEQNIKIILYKLRELNKKIQNIPVSGIDNLTSLSEILSTHTSDKNNPHSVTKAQIGLFNVDNTSDLDKPISTATQKALVDGLATKLDKGTYTGTASDLKADIDGKANTSHTHNISDVTNLQTALDLKVDKVAGKQLSTEDYTTSEKNKLAGIQSGAEINVNADWNATTGDAQILNKPTIPTKLSDLTKDINFDERYYTETEINIKTNDLQTQINDKANSVNVSAVLALKADKSTTYTKSEVDTKLEEAIYYSIIY